MAQVLNHQDAVSLIRGVLEMFNKRSMELTEECMC